MTIDGKVFDDRCIWNIIMTDKASTTRESALGSYKLELHPLFKCYCCERPNYSKRNLCPNYISDYSIKVKENERI